MGCTCTRSSPRPHPHPPSPAGARCPALQDPEALFFAFYYQPDSYQQYLAAQVGSCWRTLPAGQQLRRKRAGQGRAGQHLMGVPAVPWWLQELKRQSWRYHKHHNAWFQRYAEPQHTTDEYEQVSGAGGRGGRGGRVCLQCWPHLVSQPLPPLLQPCMHATTTTQPCHLLLTPGPCAPAAGHIRLL